MAQATVKDLTRRTFLGTAAAVAAAPRSKSSLHPIRGVSPQFSVGCRYRRAGSLAQFFTTPTVRTVTNYNEL